jgi:hypothetical protein
MIRLLLIVLLIGSPREVSNRVVKHRVSKPHLPKVVSFRPLATNAPPQTTITLYLDNPNPTSQRWVIESSPNVKPFTWTALTNGTVVPNGSVAVVIQHQSPHQFYRAGFVWP